jgi:hypothetical protein
VLLLLFKVRAERRRLVVLGTLTLLFVLSLADQLYWAARNVDRAYYGTDTRLYQLLAGVLLTAIFAFTTRRVPARIAHAVAVVGVIGLVVVASGLVDPSPSWRGIGAMVFAVLALGGLAQAAGSPLARVLSVRPMVYLGRISYGTYLWHWPVIVALRTVLDTGPVQIAVLAFGLATGLAALSSELLELPIRKSPSLDRLTWPVVVTGLSVSALVAVLVVPPVLHQVRRPAVADVAASGSGLTTDPALTRELAAKVPPLDFAKIAGEVGRQQSCTADDPSACESVRGSGPTVLLIGDSQAETMVPVFKKLAREHDFNLDLDVVAGCPWQEGLLNDKQAAAGAATCTKARVDWYDKALPVLDPDLVVLLGRPRDDPAEWGSLVARRDGKKQPLQQAVWETSRDTVDKITKVAPVAIVQRLIMPETFDPVDCLASAQRVGQCAVTAQAKPSATDGFATTLSVQNPQVHTIDLNSIFCPTAPVCSPVLDGDAVWMDDHHFSVDITQQRSDQVWKALQSTGLLN